MVTAGGVRCRLSAARLKLRCLATSVKTLNCRKVTLRIQQFLNSWLTNTEFT